MASGTGPRLVSLPKEVLSMIEPTFDSREPADAQVFILIKLIQMIAALVPDDVDLCHMARTCRYVAETIVPSYSGVWRSRFLDKYAPPPSDKSSEEVKIEYKVRSIMLSRTPSFQNGEGRKETLWLGVLSTLLAESYNTPYQQGDEETCVSRNHACIKGAIMGCDFFNATLIGDGSSPATVPSRLYLAVQLATTCLALDLRLYFRSLRTDYDLKIKRHLTNADEDTFYSSFYNIAEIKKPKTWEADLVGNRNSLAIRCLYPSISSQTNCVAGTPNLCRSDNTHALLLKLTTTDRSIWFDIYNESFPINARIPNSCRTYFRGTQTLDNRPQNHQVNPGISNNNDSADGNPIRGFTEPCPPQAGIPGWRRICFVIYSINPEYFVFIPDGEGNDEEGESEWMPYGWTTVDLWAYGYEGVIVPGGGIMMGRWKNMLRMEEMGPFIFWGI
ncbi:hypothetical protein AJ79_09688 [Helicocarpus griseus UAMH5409]|uniref:Uncharacterized protein n=1 Tax=Helicocarpus griseus UAMH5409 TaxID=1447875 RepID=A0A2B7WHZ0_9EURO|nr:hypothetical protein AJ79_09688 [Helicocarpus griseus UAMH5409]